MKTSDTIFIHEDVENLKFFVDKFGIPCSCSRAILYAMQGADVVGIFYTNDQASSFYDRNKYKENLPVIGKFSTERWDDRRINKELPIDFDQEFKPI